MSMWATYYYSILPEYSIALLVQLSTISPSQDLAASAPCSSYGSRTSEPPLALTLGRNRDSDPFLCWGSPWSHGKEANFISSYEENCIWNRFEVLHNFFMYYFASVRCVCLVHESVTELALGGQKTNSWSWVSPSSVERKHFTCSHLAGLKVLPVMMSTLYILQVTELLRNTWG